MGTLHKIELSSRELSDLRKIQDSYTAERSALDNRLKESLNTFWMELRSEYSLVDEPFHIMGTDIWYLKDGNKEECEAFIKMTSYK